VLSEAFTRGVGQRVGFEKLAKLREQGDALGVALAKETGMVEVLLEPCAEVFQVSEIDNEALGIGLTASEGEGDRPIMTVNEGTVTVVSVLPMGKGNVVVGFFAGQHNI
jgi:uncharacterized protein involved in propanediol utilization